MKIEGLFFCLLFQVKASSADPLEMTYFSHLYTWYPISGRICNYLQCMHNMYTEYRKHKRYTLCRHKYHY